jgi:hypothetical protein
MGEVKVEWNSQRRQLIIRDNGTGMTQQIIEDHLLTVGSSYYQSAQVREQYADFSSISRFGIGVLSVFMISDEIEFLTVHPDEEFARTLTLPSVQHRYLIKTLPKDHEKAKVIGTHGTQISLTVRASAKLEDIVEIVRHWIVVPRCRVTVAVDDDPVVEVGFHDVKSALDYYVNQYVPPPTGGRRIESVCQTADGVDFAYSVKYSPYLDSWDFLRRDTERLIHTMNVASRRVNLISVPGVCVEGVRVDSRPPGFAELGGPWALANVTGAPRTNVARSDLEQNEELEEAVSSIYRMLVKHSLDEFERLVESGASLLKAAREADYIWTFGLDSNTKLYPAVFDNCVDEVPIIVIENGETVQPVSRKFVQDSGSIWTVDSPLLEHIEGLAQSLNVALPAEQIIERLNGAKAQDLPLPRLLGRSIKPLSGVEIAEARVDRENQRIDFCWKKQSGRWVNLKEILPLLQRDLRIGDGYGEYYDNYQDTLFRSVRSPASLAQYWMVSSADVHLQCPDIDMIEWRGRIFILPGSPIAMLYDIFGMDERFAQWVLVLLQSREIPSDRSLLLRKHLQDANRLPEEVLPKLVISPDRMFGISYFQRSPSQE